MTVFTLLTAIIIAFVYGWQLTLLILACIPFVIAANAANVSSVSGHAAKDQKALEEAGRVSSPILTTGLWCEITFKDNIIAILQLTQLSKINEVERGEGRMGDEGNVYISLRKAKHR